MEERNMAEEMAVHRFHRLLDAERRKQVEEKGFTAEHDQKRPPEYWVWAMLFELTELLEVAVKPVDISGPSKEARHRLFQRHSAVNAGLVKVAAVAMAAFEARS